MENVIFARYLLLRLEELAFPEVTSEHISLEVLALGLEEQS